MKHTIATAMKRTETNWTLNRNTAYSSFTSTSTYGWQPLKRYDLRLLLLYPSLRYLLNLTVVILSYIITQAWLGDYHQQGCCFVAKSGMSGANLAFESRSLRRMFFCVHFVTRRRDSEGCCFVPPKRNEWCESCFRVTNLTQNVFLRSLRDT